VYDVFEAQIFAKARSVTDITIAAPVSNSQIDNIVSTAACEEARPSSAIAIPRDLFAS